MPTVESIDAHRDRHRPALERDGRCARAGCPHQRLAAEDAAGLCLACTVEAELFDREARWERLARRR